MKLIGIKEMFKVSIGPSSSHTMGPWVAARHFCHNNTTILMSIQTLTVRLCGSLAKTGRGHNTPMGILMGLMDKDPALIDSEEIPLLLKQQAEAGTLKLSAETTIAFDLHTNIIFDRDTPTPVHPNTLIFEAFLKDKTLHCETYYSVGGGFIEHANANTSSKQTLRSPTPKTKAPPQDTLPFPFTRATELESHLQKTELQMHELLLRNETAVRSIKEVEAHALTIYETMCESVYKGCHRNGILPGGLHVNRRAALMAQTLYRGGPYANKEEWFANIRKTAIDKHQEVSQWVSCFALAVNEENATYGKIVTAPTNGAAGVVPSILLYYLTFDPSADVDRKEKILEFLLIASHIGYLFKENATISAAAGGCQGEIGVSSAMAAAALTYIRGGDARKTMMASEIAMEHHLGLTCDPVRGLVQVPCIERNAMGAVKAITASQLAFSSDPNKAVVNLDQVIDTMWQTAKEMSHKYKETSEGGLAVNVGINYSEC